MPRRSPRAHGPAARRPRPSGGRAAAFGALLWVGLWWTPAPAQPAPTGPAATGAPTSHVAEVNGVRLRFQRMGSGERAVVLLHGWPQHSLMWKRIMPPLAAAGFTVIAPDQRGAGGSGIPGGGYDKATMAEDLHALVRRLGFSRVDLVGYDHGAGVAYAFAAAHPEMVGRLALIEYLIAGTPARTQALSPSPDPARWNSGSNWHSAFFTLPDVAEWLFKGRERELLAWMFWHISCNPGAIDPADFEDYVRQVGRPGALRAGIQYYATIWADIAHNERAMATKLAMPVLAVGGACSAGAGVEASARLFASDVRGAVLEGAGHWPTDENPDGLVRLLLGFLGPGRAAGAAAPDGAVEAAARRALAAWERGEHTGDYAASRALLSPGFRLFSHPVRRRGVRRGHDARAATEAPMSSRERAPNDLAVSDGHTVVLGSHSADAIGGGTRFDGRNAIAPLMEGGPFAGFQESFGDIPPGWPR